MDLVLLLSGPIASGKTSTARRLTKQLPNATHRSFGDVARALAQARLLPPTRATLQELGAELIASGWARFVQLLLQDLPPSTTTLVIDGIRHREAVDEVRRALSGCRVVTVFLALDEVTQRRRLETRGEDAAAVTAHPIEHSLEEVKDVADLLLNGELDPSDIDRHILTLVSGA